MTNNISAPAHSGVSYVSDSTAFSLPTGTGMSYFAAGKVLARYRREGMKRGPQATLHAGAQPIAFLRDQIPFAVPTHCLGVMKIPAARVNHVAAAVGRATLERI